MASRCLNRVILVGNLTRDPELRYTPQGTAVCVFGVATNRNWVTSKGETKEETQFHRIVAWQKLAELCGKLLKKGKKVYLEGRLSYRTFTGRDGVQRTIAEIVLDDFIVFDSQKKITEETVKEEEKITTQPAIEEPPIEEIAKTADEEAQASQKKEESVNPDDIPF